MTRTDDSGRDSHPRRRSGAASHASPLQRRAYLVAAVGVGVLVVLTLADIAFWNGRIYAGVRIGAVPVGSMSLIQAEATVDRESVKRLSRPVTATHGAKVWTMAAGDVGAKIDSSGSVERAMAVGRTGSVWRRVSERFAGMFGGIDIAAKVDGDPAKIESVLDGIAEVVNAPSKSATVAIESGVASLVKAEIGIAVNRARTRAALLAAFLSDGHDVRVAVGPAPVAVSDADAAQALEDAKKLVAGPATVEYKGTTFNVARQDVARWVAFRADPAPGSSATASGTSDAIERRILVAYYEPARIGVSIIPFVGGIGRPARDAQFVAASGRVTIKPSQSGIGPDLAALSHDLGAAALAGTRRTAVMRLGVRQPKLTTEQARAMGITDRISTYTTTFAPGNKPRVNNIKLLSATLDNKLIPPGGTFSFNKSAGERTAGKGYQEAPAIVNGKLVPQLGGGVCQVGTTIFNTVFFSGLPILERRNHSFFISHYPKGRDCTVSWGGPDFKFKNDTANWILIRTDCTSGSLTVALYGTDPGYDVEYTTSDFTDIRPYPVQEIKDPTLMKGARLTEDGGVEGGKVTVVRTVYKAGQVVRTDTFVSHYKPKEEVVRVGTKAASKPGTSTAGP
ncbi:MAG: VanW family protein [Coriobacteriia bacterium]|nr:VanW family protein [Coriobacteriia bacterium]